MAGGESRKRKKAEDKPPLQTACCGTCVYSRSHEGNESLNCYAMPPHPVQDDLADPSPAWERGAPVDFNDPRCVYFIPKGTC